MPTAAELLSAFLQGEHDFIRPDAPQDLLIAVGVGPGDDPGDAHILDGGGDLGRGAEVIANRDDDRFK